MTVITQLSTKGQLVIPKQIREKLRLKRGARFEVRTEEGKIILEPLDYTSPIAFLHGRLAGTDLLAELEAEHQRELAEESGG